MIELSFGLNSPIFVLIINSKDNIFVNVKEISEGLSWSALELVLKLRGSLLNLDHEPCKKEEESLCNIICIPFYLYMSDLKRNNIFVNEE